MTNENKTDGSDHAVGYEFTDTGIFQLSVYPSSDENNPGLIIIGTPWSETVAWGPTSTDYWDKEPDEIRHQVISEYLKGLDGDWGTITSLYREAERIGVELREEDSRE